MRKRTRLILLLIFIWCACKNIVYANSLNYIENQMKSNILINTINENSINTNETSNNFKANEITEKNIIKTNDITDNNISKNTNEIIKNSIENGVITNNTENTIIENTIKENNINNAEMPKGVLKSTNLLTANTNKYISNENDLRYYLELNDSNTYNIYLNNDITITKAIFCVGNKKIYGQGHTIKSNFNIGEISAIHIYGKASIDNTKFNGNNLQTEASNKVSVREGGELTVSNCSFYGGTQGIHVDTTSTLIVNSGNFYNNDLGIGSLGKVTINNANIYNNSQGVHNNGGTVNIKGGEYHDNMWGILVIGTGNISAGNFYKNEVGIRNSGADTVLSITGGSTYNNGIGIRSTGKTSISNVTLKDNTESGVHHAGTLCAITGGNFGKNQVVYLAGDDKFVTTYTSFPVFEVKPNTYTKGRVLVKTSANQMANAEIKNVALTKNSNWTTKVNNNNIVLWKKGEVIVKYIDDSKNQIINNVTISGYVDDNYNTEQKSFYGYNLIQIPNNKSGKIAENTTTVIYIYKSTYEKVELPKTGGNSIIFLMIGSIFIIISLNIRKEVKNNEK